MMLVFVWITFPTKTGVKLLEFGNYISYTSSDLTDKNKNQIKKLEKSLEFKQKTKQKQNLRCIALSKGMPYGKRRL